MSRKAWMDWKERKELQRLYDSGMPIMEIAQALGRNKVTIYRELKKGYTGVLDENGRDAYSAELGQNENYAVRKSIGARRFLRRDA